MSTNPDNDRVNQLISEKRYEDAKAILRQSSNPGAQQWLARLESLYPTPRPTVRSQPGSEFGPYGLGMATGYGQATSSSRYSYGPTTYERGGCLTVWLIAIGALNVIIAILTLIAGALVQVILSAFVVTCIVGVWNQQKWGYFGMLAAYGVSIAANLFLWQSILAAIFGIIGLTITYALVNPQLDQFT